MMAINWHGLEIQCSSTTEVSVFRFISLDIWLFTKSKAMNKLNIIKEDVQFTPLAEVS